jgi:hypothetical protein
MVSAKPSTEDEAAFMNDLLANFDVDAFFSTGPSPVSSPVKTDLLRTTVNFSTPVKPKPENRAKKSPIKPIAQVEHFASTDDFDQVGLLDGLGDCEWKDMEADFLSPKKLAVKPSKVRL